MIKDASRTREAEPLLVDKTEKYVSDVSRDGQYVVYTSREKGGSWDIRAMPLGSDRKPFPVVKTAFNEMWATLSPDGKYLAYQSNQSWQNEIYVQEFPEARNRSQISTNVGVHAHWRGDGRELFCRSGPRLMAVLLHWTSALR